MKSRAWLRPVLVILMIVVWMGIGGAGGQTFGVLSSVQENENSVFLPSSAESTKAADAHADFVPSDAVPGLFVIDGAGPISRQSCSRSSTLRWPLRSRVTSRAAPWATSWRANRRWCPCLLYTSDAA